MAKTNRSSTKENILRTAAKLFSEQGSDKVTTREIAKAIGINSASIYYHFSSKEDLLKSLYKLYSEERRKQYPDLQELLRLAETEPPHDVLMKSEFHYQEDIREMLDQIIVIATCRIKADPESESFVRENIFDSIINFLKPLLERLVELGRIEPLDIDAFLGILCYYCFSAAALNNSPFRQGVAEYQTAMSHIFSMITPVGHA
jgi:AcrR family transcriptional regulator